VATQGIRLAPRLVADFVIDRRAQDKAISVLLLRGDGRAKQEETNDIKSLVSEGGKRLFKSGRQGLAVLPLVRGANDCAK
jgi:hypothetical protein